MASPDKAQRNAGSLDAWIHQQLMQGTDEICFTYRREVEHLRSLAVEGSGVPSFGASQHQRILRKWRRIAVLEAARLQTGPSLK